MKFTFVLDTLLICSCLAGTVVRRQVSFDGNTQQAGRTAPLRIQRKPTETLLKPSSPAANLNKLASAVQQMLLKKTPVDQTKLAEAKEVEALAKGLVDKDTGAAAKTGHFPLLEDVPQAKKELIMSVIREADKHFTAEGAARAGLEITQQFIDALIGKQDERHHLVPIEEACGKDCHEGDMKASCPAQHQLFLELEEKARSGQTPSYGAGKPWSGATMSYCFDTNIKAAAKEAVALGMAQISKAVPCMKFIDVGYKGGGKCNSGPAVYITSENTGCWSYVGEISFWQSQQLNLQSPGCDSVGTAIHEILHALGMAHEQSRPDRETYVSVNYGNINANGAGQFDIDSKADKERPYDILSVMHYGLSAFSNGGGDTISVKPAGYARYTTNPAEYSSFQAGNRVGMTQLDADQLADHYRSAAGGQCSSSKLVTVDSSCSDTLQNGQAWTDVYGQGCETYYQMQVNGQISACSAYVSGLYCCKCGGGLRLQEWTQTGTSPGPNPSPPPPPPSPSTCADSGVYRDPSFQDNCNGWSNYQCTGFAFSDELIAACPKACGTCTPGTPSPPPPPPPP
eukprot:CAMPEP_0197661992 /NCGR_PEP_ID=MMETSP1338-20131121/51794_1 /TAXON_ID=43686 ORGANISM="Pelagodinium beii, Strain RCC1491" /NCGR_SAMPLE_ID=MMETSP1338 /ASSEMBLY_ACC=CAM_ASM_000754 /LENGTH=568 /DNA_ID=CAMNT_0043239657 /DNA_START=83 /DNA_END=1785 /DNA_ORIENTATION=-